MANIKAFKAVRPPRDKVALVSCKSLDLYSKNKAQSKLDFNPYTFLQITNAVYKYSKDEVSHEKKFRLVSNRYAEFKEEKILSKDKKESLYIYKKISGSKKYWGIIAGISIEDIKNKTIKKHEETLKEKELFFEKYLSSTKFNAEPVMISYPDNQKIEEIIKKYTKTRAEYEFSTLDKNLHKLWIIDDFNDINSLKNEFKNINELFIADGHHRTCASVLISEKLKKSNPNHNGSEDYNFFMCYLIPESKLNISAFNRFVTDLNGYSHEDFLIELDTYFKITKYGEHLYIPTEKKCFSMYLNGSFYALEYRQNQKNNQLDSEILYHRILHKLLGINDIRYDTRIYYSNTKDPLELKTKVDSKEFAVSFGMKAISLNEIKSVIKQDKTLLPKTTYIEPKIRSAMTIYEW